MKKRILLILILAVAFVTACGSGGSKNKAERSYEDLIDVYIKGYVNADPDAFKDVFPDYYCKAQEAYFTKEYLGQMLESAKERYGEDFKITYEVTKETKLTEEELKTLNKKLKSRYNATVDATECYKYEGTITFAGSKYSDPDPISTVGRCKYNGTWYLTGMEL